MTDQAWIENRAGELRQSLVDAEMIVWSRLRARRLAGYRFRRQHVVGRFILDFYCAEKRLAIEIDGPTHDAARDARRDHLLGAAGIEVMRVPNEDVFEILDDVLGAVKAALDASPSWERRKGRTRVTRR